jgi:hypothetical protein
VLVDHQSLSDVNKCIFCFSLSHHHKKKSISPHEIIVNFFSNIFGHDNNFISFFVKELRDIIDITSLLFGKIIFSIWLSKQVRIFLHSLNSIRLSSSFINS